MRTIENILEVAVKANASDVHIKTYSVPVFRINGRLIKVDDFGVIKPEEVDVMVKTVLNEENQETFTKEKEIDFAYSLPGTGRFRVNLFKQRSSIGMVFRLIPFSVQPMDDLHLPPILKKVAMFQRGLVLLTGTTGSGKSTTLASMIDYINNNKTCHIMTIEDPIEFLLKDKHAVINQRELGIDTYSFSKALRSALRQDPDIIMVGEMRDLETIEIALTAAETGHLVFSTLHTLDAAETINRIIGVFPVDQQEQIRQQLASVLRAVVSQRLIKTKDGRKRVPAVEVLINTLRVRDIILDPPRFKEIGDVIQSGYMTYGMQSFDQSIYSLYKEGFITWDAAMQNATSPDDLALRMKGVSVSGDGDWKSMDKSKENPELRNLAKSKEDDDFEFE